MSDNSNPDDLASFQDLTSTSIPCAVCYLSLSNGDLGEAVNLYFNDPSLYVEQPAAGGGGGGGGGGLDIMGMGMGMGGRQSDMDQADSPFVPRKFNSNDDEDDDDDDYMPKLNEPNNNNNSSDDNNNNNQFDSDAAYAQSLADADSKRSADSEKTVRKPDESKAMNLMNDNYYGGGGGGGLYDADDRVDEYNNGGGGAHAAALAAMQALTRGEGMGGGAMGGAGMGGLRMPLHQQAQPRSWTEADGIVQNTTSQTLKSLFAHPTYTTPGAFADLRELGKEHKKWLLVNIQSESDFACHALNRDVWSDECVKDLVLSHFIFVQYQNDEVEGKLFCTRHDVTTFPHLSILDPRTGRLIWRRDGWSLQSEDCVGVESICETVVDFLGRNSMEEGPKINASNQAGYNGSNASGSASASEGNNGKGKRLANVLTEDEQLEAAIRASMGGGGGGGGGGGSNKNGGSSSSNDDDDDDNEDELEDESTVVYSDDDDEDELQSSRNSTKTDNSPNNSYSSRGTNLSSSMSSSAVKKTPTPKQTITQKYSSTIINAEPPDTSDNIFTLQIRLGQRGKLLRRFLASALVDEVVAFIVLSPEYVETSLGGRGFEMRMGNRSLLVPGEGKTLEEVGVSKREAITIYFEEDEEEE